jgi:hypothetical protein
MRAQAGHRVALRRHPRSTRLNASATLLTGLVGGLLFSSLCSGDAIAVGPAAPHGLVVVHRLDGGGLLGGAAADRGLWLLQRTPSGEARLQRFVPPATLRPLPTPGVGSSPVALTYAFGSVWVANSTNDNLGVLGKLTNTVTRISPLSGKRQLLLHARMPSQVLASSHLLWVAALQDVRAISPSTGKLVARISIRSNSLVRLAPWARGVIVGMTGATGSRLLTVTRDGRRRARRNLVLSVAGLATAQPAGSRLWVSSTGWVAQWALPSLSRLSGRARVPGAGMVLPISDKRAYVVGAHGTVWNVWRSRSTLRAAVAARVGHSADLIFRTAGYVIVYDSSRRKLVVLR